MAVRKAIHLAQPGDKVRVAEGVLLGRGIMGLVWGANG